MNTYDPVKKAMSAGTPLELICTSCPWDRLCVQPPQVSSADIEKQLDEAQKKDEQANPQGGKLPAHMLMTAMLMAGKDSSGQMCPVFSARLKSPEGRQIADAIRNTMRTLGEVA